MIGLHMITLNCADQLDKCLKSAEGLADVLSVCDTGSTDETIRIAQNHGAIISNYRSREGWNHPFIDDFSAARNKALQALPPDVDWFTWLDSDDLFMKKGDPVKLRNYLLSLGKNPQLVSMPYIYSHERHGDKLEPELVYYIARCWTKLSGSIWRGRVHELKGPAGECIKHVYHDVSIHHFKEQNTSYSDRNLIILEDIMSNDGGTGREVFYYAKELTYHAKLPHAIAWFKICLERPDIQVMERNRAIYEIGFCYWQLGMKELAKNYFFDAIKDNPAHAEPYYYLGMYFADRDDFAKAIGWFLHAANMPEPGTGWFDYIPYRTYKPLEWASICAWYLGDRQKAEAFHERAKKLAPGDKWIQSNDHWFEKEKNKKKEIIEK